MCNLISKRTVIIRDIVVVVDKVEKIMFLSTFTVQYTKFEFFIILIIFMYPNLYFKFYHAKCLMS